ncbi:MAG: hypothetical protein M3135_00195 [Actinomycetota bacterium]|nr:hypothetical protein [Actinomycetota bacterium]
MNPFFLVAALMDLTAVVVHGYIGHRLFLTPLTPERLFPTRGFGDADTSRRIFIVSWHAVTAAFASSAVMMALLASGAVASRPAALFLSAMHAGFLVVGLVVTGRRIGRWIRRPRLIPLGFVIVMTTVALMGWLGSS